MEQKWKDPEFRRKMQAGQIRRYQDVNERVKTSEIMKRVTQKKYDEDSEYRIKLSDAAKKRYQNSEERAKTSNATKKLWADPEYREKQRIATKKRYKKS